MPLLLLPALQLPGWLSLAILVMLAGGFFKTWRSRVMLLHPEAVRVLHWGEGKSCLLELNSGKQQPRELCRQVFIMPWLVIICFKKTAIGRYSLLLLPDMLDSEQFRRLRVRLQLEINTP